MGIVIFNGRSSKEYGIEVETFPDYEIPKRDYEIIHVPGRNGDIVLDKGSYQNVKGTYKISFGSEKNLFPEMAARVTEWLHSASGYAILEDSYQPDIYRKAMFYNDVDISNIYNHGGRTTIVFDCMPQKFLKSGDEAIEFLEPDSIFNPTVYDAKPLLKVTGRGTGTANINNYIVEFNFLHFLLTAASIKNFVIDTDKFINKITQKGWVGNDLEFVCNGLDLDSSGSSIDEEVTMTVTTDKATFDAKTGDTDKEHSYSFSYAEGLATFDTSNCDYISSAQILEGHKSDFMSRYSEGQHSALCTEVSLAVSTPQGASFTVSVVPSTFLSAIGNDSNNIYPFYYSNGLWTDYSGYTSSDLNVYGITVTGTPSEGDGIVIEIEGKWKIDEEASSYYANELYFSYGNRPSVNDSISFNVEYDSWILDELGRIDISEYGITYTYSSGSVNYGDHITVNRYAKWKVNDTYDTSKLEFTSLGITYSGNFVENDTFTIYTLSEITLDCEVKEAYTGLLNRNKDVILPNDFPLLTEGSNNISFTDGITKIEVTPRWWIQ